MFLQPTDKASILTRCRAGRITMSVENENIKGGARTSYTPAPESTAVAAPFRA